MAASADERKVSAEQARVDFSEIVNRAAYGKEHTVITRYSKEVAAVVSIEELRLLQAVLEHLEYKQDLEDARVALEEAEKEGTVPWAEVKAKLGL